MDYKITTVNKTEPSQDANLIHYYFYKANLNPFSMYEPLWTPLDLAGCKILEETYTDFCDKKLSAKMNKKLDIIINNFKVDFKNMQIINMKFENEKRALLRQKSGNVNGVYRPDRYKLDENIHTKCFDLDENEMILLKFPPENKPIVLRVNRGTNLTKLIKDKLDMKVDEDKAYICDEEVIERMAKFFDEEIEDMSLLLGIKNLYKDYFSSRFFRNRNNNNSSSSLLNGECFFELFVRMLTAEFFLFYKLNEQLLQIESDKKSSTSKDNKVKDLATSSLPSPSLDAVSDAVASPESSAQQTTQFSLAFSYLVTHISFSYLVKSTKNYLRKHKSKNGKFYLYSTQKLKKDKFFLFRNALNKLILTAGFISASADKARVLSHIKTEEKETINSLFVFEAQNFEHPDFENEPSILSTIDFSEFKSESEFLIRDRAPIYMSSYHWDTNGRHAVFTFQITSLIFFDYCNYLNSLKEINLVSNELDKNKIAFHTFTEAMKINTSISYLNIDWNNMGKAKENMKNLCSALAVNKTILHLSLSGNFLGLSENYEAVKNLFETLPQTNIKKVNLEYNAFDTKQSLKSLKLVIDYARKNDKINLKMREANLDKKEIKQLFKDIEFLPIDFD